MRYESETAANVSLCLFFGRGPRFCFSVHSVFSAPKARFPRIMRSFRFRFRRTFRFVRTARTGADSGGQSRTGQGGERVAAELPSFCRRFSVSLSVSILRSGKTFRLPPTLDALKRSAFYALREGREPPGKKNALRGISRLWRVCAEIAHTRPAEFSAQAKQAARMLPGV